MRLIKCYIENFGRIKKQEIDLSENLIMIEEKNGWGKTTLATFIKVMLYGMKDSRKKELSERERDKYRPWTGEQYGGNLEIEINNNKYRIIRFFGKTEREDSFSVIDLATNKEEKKFSKNIGEEIFKLDRESFEKSIYIPQQQIHVEKSNSLITKLTNLDNMQDDMNRYEIAMKQIENKLKKIKKDLKDNKEQTSYLKEKIEETTIAEQNYEQYKIRVAGYNSNKEENEKQIEEKEKVLKAYSNIKIKEEKKKLYNSLLEDLEKTQIEKNKIIDFFKGKIPNGEQLKEQQVKIQKVNLTKKNGENIVVTDEERELLATLQESFKNGIPSDEDLEKWNKKIIEFNKLKNQRERQELSEEDLQELESFKKRAFGELTEEAIDEKVKELKEIETIQTTLKDKEREIEYREKDIEKITLPIVKNTKFVILGIIIAAIIGIIFITKIYGIISLVIMMGLIGFQFLRVNKVKKEKDIAISERLKVKQDINKMEEEKTQLNNEKSNLQKTVNDFVEKHIINVKDIQSQILTLKFEYVRFIKLMQNTDLEKEVVEKLEDEIKEKEKELKEYFNNFNISFKEYSESLTNLRKNKKNIEYLQSKIEAFDNNETIIKNILPEIKEFFSTYFSKDYDNYEENLDVIKAKIVELEKINEDCDTIQKKIEEFKKENDIEKLEQVEENTQTQEEVETQIYRLKQIQKEILHNLAANLKELNRFESEAEEKNEYEEQLENVKQEKTENEKKKSILERTQEIMQKAKEKLSIIYVAGMNENLRKYIEIIAKNDDNTLKNLNINTDLEVNVEIDGTQKEVEYFSTGCKDLIGVSTRFALIDSIFKEEKPFIILDDPFVNLDKDKIENAKALINEISKKYQILYFSCHECRRV